jgi:phage major head subunit gpT-like protein
MLIKKNTLSALYVALKAQFNVGLAGAESQWRVVATEVPSNAASNQYDWLGELPQMREWIGDRVVKNVSQFSYTIRNKDFESTIAVKRNDVEDNQLGMYNTLAQELGRVAGEHPDELVFKLLASGFNTLCYDGQNFFDTDHPVTNADGTVSSVSNYGGGALAPWFLIDDSRVLKPIIYQNRKAPNLVSKTDETDDNVFLRKEYLYGVDVRRNVGFGLWQLAYASKQDLTSANFNAAYDAMIALRGDEDRKLNIKPRKLLVGASNRAKALEVIKAERLANGATNTNRDLVEVIVVPWLD